MRRGVKVFLGAVLLIIEIVSFLFLLSFIDKDKKPPDSFPVIEQPSEDEPTDEKHNVYKIHYVGVMDGEEIEIPEFMYSKSGSYPTLYISGRETEVSDLLGKMELVEWEEIGSVRIGSGVADPEDELTDWEFYGWYWGNDLVNEFSGIIPNEQAGEITLYAKIDCAEWSNNH